MSSDTTGPARSRRGLPWPGLAAAATALCFVTTTACSADDDPGVRDLVTHQKAGMGMGGLSPTAVAGISHVRSVSHPPMESPLRIAEGPDGRFAVSDPRGKGVHLLAPDLQLIRTLRTVRLPMGVAWTADGDLAIGDGVNGRVVLVSEWGEVLGDVGAGVGEFVRPSDIAVDPANGELWITDSGHARIVHADATGQILSTFGTRGTADGQLETPVGIALGPDGRLYVTDMRQGRAYVYGKDGVHQGTLAVSGDGDGKLVRPGGLAIGADGRAYIAEIFQGQVEILESDGTFVGWLSSMGSNPGQLGLPNDVILDSHGRLLITSHRTERIEVFGVGDFTPVPPGDLVASTVLVPDTLNLRRRAPKIDLVVDVPGADAAIDPATVRLDGTLPPASPVLTETGVTHRGLPFEAKLRFWTFPVLQLYGTPGIHMVDVTGALVDGRKFQGTFRLTVVPDAGQGN